MISLESESIARLRALVWLRAIVCGIVDDEGDVQVFAREAAGEIIYQIQVNAGDLGKVIGKQGRTARALRLLLAARAKKDGLRYGLDIDETVDERERA